MQTEAKFQHPKGQIFLLCGWVWIQIKGKGWALLLHLKEDMWQVLFEKKKRKKKRKSFFLKQPKSSLSPFRKFQKLFLLPRCFSSFFFSTIEASIKAPKFLLISTPNCKEKPFSESWNLPQLRRASNFRYGWTSSHMKFVGVGFLGVMMGSSTRLLP